MQVAIHAGAAFTDEGSLLRSLQANRQILADNGAILFGPRRFRQEFRPAFRFMHDTTQRNAALDRIRGTLPPDDSAQRSIFLSDHMFGGGESYLEDGQLYPLAGQRMAFLDEAFADAQVELFFALKNPGSFVPKHLMTLSEAEREDLIRSTDLSCLGWSHMIDDIRDLAPNVQITLWCNEDCPFIWGDVIRAISGLSYDADVRGEYALLLSLLTEDGQRQAGSLIESATAYNRSDVRGELGLILAENALPEMVEEELELPGWSAEVVEAFSELYEQEVDRLQTLPGVRMLTV